MNENIYTHCIAVIVAGGQGLRMQNAIPKQFLPLNNKPILAHTINAFVQALPGIRIVLVLPATHFSYANALLQHFPEGIDMSIVSGGSSRFESVRIGLKEARAEDIIFVHDGVRPLVSQQLIISCYEHAIRYGSAIPTLPLTDTIRHKEGEHSQTIDRSYLYAVQTPQTFKGDILLPAYEQEYQPFFTDEATVVENYGQAVHLVEGEKANIKITTPEDLRLAAALQSLYDEI